MPRDGWERHKDFTAGWPRAIYRLLPALHQRKTLSGPVGHDDKIHLFARFDYPNGANVKFRALVEN